MRTSIVIFANQPGGLTAETFLPTLEGVLTQEDIGLYPKGINVDSVPRVIEYSTTPLPSRNPPLLYAPHLYPTMSPIRRLFCTSDRKRVLSDPMASEYWRLQDIANEVNSMLEERPGIHHFNSSAAAIEFLTLAGGEASPDVRGALFLKSALLMSELEGDGAGALARQAFKKAAELASTKYAKALILELEAFSSIEERQSMMDLHLEGNAVDAMYACVDEDNWDIKYDPIVLYQGLSHCLDQNTDSVHRGPGLLHLSEKLYAQHGRPDIAAADALRAAWAQARWVAEMIPERDHPYFLLDLIDSLQHAAVRWNEYKPDTPLAHVLNVFIGEAEAIVVGEMKEYWDQDEIRSFLLENEKQHPETITSLRSELADG